MLRDLRQLVPNDARRRALLTLLSDTCNDEGAKGGLCVRVAQATANPDSNPNST